MQVLSSIFRLSTALNGDAPEELLPHALVGKWQGYRECHIEPDWLRKA